MCACVYTRACTYVGCLANREGLDRERDNGEISVESRRDRDRDSAEVGEAGGLEEKDDETGAMMAANIARAICHGR